MSTENYEEWDINKVYTSPSKECVVMYVNGRWEQYTRNDIAAGIFKQGLRPIPVDYWIFYTERLPLKAGWYETKDSDDDKITLFHGGGGLQNQWWKDEGYVEKVTNHISYWRPIQKSNVEAPNSRVVE